MKSTFAWLSVLLALSVSASDDFDAQEMPALDVRCNYADTQAAGVEQTIIQHLPNGGGGNGGVRQFRRGGKNQDARLGISPGEFAECIYPSGNRVKVKVGMTSAKPYGMCGGEPEIFASIWVNRRKVASRVGFAGHCRAASGLPAVSFEITATGSPVIVKCHASSENPNQKVLSNTPAAELKSQRVCIEYPEVARYPVDFLEYPKDGTKAPQVGDVEILRNGHDVCSAVKGELDADFMAFRNPSRNWKTALLRHKWHPANWNFLAAKELPDEMAGSEESAFDFDNDGNLDRVLMRQFSTSYYDGSVLFVQPGVSATEVVVPDSSLRGSLFLPCQLESPPHKIETCPLFSQQKDEAGFSVKGRTDKETVRFRTRYSHISPFSFQGTTYLGINSMSEDTLNYAAVFKPLPRGKFEPVCLFRKVVENF